MSMNKRKEKYSKKLILDWIIPIVIAVILAFLINRFIIFKIKIPSESMVPTLNIGDELFANRIYNPDNLDRGNLVVFNFEPEKKLYIIHDDGTEENRVINIIMNSCGKIDMLNVFL